MKRFEKVVVLVLCLVLALSLAAQAAEVITLEVAAEQPEYEAQERAIWDLFEKENPNIKIELSSYNEDALPALFARVAGGDPLDIATRLYATKDNYKQWVDLKTIDFKYWDNFTLDMKNEWSNATGVPDYTPVIWPFAGLVVSFLYDANAMEAAGIDASNIRTWEEVDAMLAKLKTYVDSDPKLEYVISTGNHTWCWPYMLANPIMTSLDPAAQEKSLRLMKGEIKWADMDQNPWVPFFKWLKDYYDKGYFPKNFWETTWDEYEAGMVAGTSILTIHGPWIWDKLEAADPTIELAGFPIPANSEGKIQAFPDDIQSQQMGSGIYVDPKRSDAEMAATVKAFNWYLSPEIVKLRTEALSKTPQYDLSSVGGADVQGTQFQSIIKAVTDGKFGDISWDSTPFGMDVATAWYIEGKPGIHSADDLMEIWGKYLSNQITLEQLMGLYQQRFDAAYDISKAK